MAERKGINDIGPKTVQNVVDLMDPDTTIGSDRNDYDKAIIEAAYRLRGLGLVDFTYQGASGSSTLWISPTGKGGLRVYADGRLG